MLKGNEPFITKEQAAPYLAALIDGEGCVYYGGSPTAGRRVGKRCVQIAMTEWDAIQAAVSCCEHLGIGYSVSRSVRRPPNKAVYTLMIAGRENLELCAEVLPLQLMRKRQKLVDALASYAPAGRTRRGWRRVDQDEVRERVRRFGGVEAAAALGRLLGERAA